MAMDKLEACNNEGPDTNKACREAISGALLKDLELYTARSGRAMPAETDTKPQALDRIEQQHQPKLKSADATIDEALERITQRARLGSAEETLKHLRTYNDLAIKNEADGTQLGDKRGEADRQIQKYLSLSANPKEQSALGQRLAQSGFAEYFQSSVELDRMRKQDPAIQSWNWGLPLINRAMEQYANYGNALRNSGFVAASDRAYVGMDAIYKRLVPLENH